MLKKKLQPFDNAPLVFLVSAVASSFLYSKHFDSRYLVDDAFIYLRVVDNILQGHGWVYNIGEKINPCSAVSYTLVLLIIGAILKAVSALSGFPLLLEYAPGIVQVLSCSTIATVTWLALGNRSTLQRMACSAVIAFNPILMLTAGMESAFFIASLSLSAYFYVRRSYGLLGFALAMTCLGRLEGIAMLAMVLALLWYRERHIVPRFWLSLLLPLLAWHGYSYLNFAELLPHSTLIKANQYTLTIPQFSERSFIGKFIAQPLSIVFTVVAMLVGVYALFKQWRNEYLIVLVLFGGIQFTVYGYKNASGFFWYMTPAMVGANILCLVGILWVLQSLYARWRASSMAELFSIEMNGMPYIAPMASLAGAMLLITIVSVWGIRPYQMVQPYRFLDQYRDISQWVNSHSKQSDSLSAIEIGYLGYYTQQPIVDPMGLIHKEAIDGLKQRQWDWWYGLKPHLIVIRKYPAAKTLDIIGNFMRPSYVQDFKQRYKIVVELSGHEIWRAQTL